MIDENDQNQVNLQAENALSKMLLRLKLISDTKLPNSFDPLTQGQISFLAASGVFDEWEAIEKISEELQIQIVYFDPDQQEECFRLLKEPPLRNVDTAKWKQMHCCPVALSETCVLVAMSNPLDQGNRISLEFEFGRKVEVAIASDDDILQAITNSDLSKAEYNLAAILSKTKPEKVVRPGDVTAPPESIVGKDNPEADPVIRLVNKIFHDAIRLDASDIHLTPGKKGLSVKARVDSIMEPLFTIPEEHRKGVISRIKLLAQMDIAERRLPQDGRLHLKTVHGEKDLRVSTVPANYGENIVARILAAEFDNRGLESVGMPEDLEKCFRESLHSTSKVILVTGPTGSGKTSTLYASLLHLRNGQSNIITLEDPIEYKIDDITQIQVNTKISFGFADGLRSILRQDPDIILVGEIRDVETASTAMQVAQTGHLVLSTLHTNSAPAAITRLKDLDVPNYLIASSLGAILSQRLVRKLCEHCAVGATLDAKQRAELYEIDVDNMRTAGEGCDSCNRGGYKGRAGVFSFLELSDDVLEAVRLDLGEEEIADRGRINGYKTLHDAAAEFIANGMTSLEEVERVLGPYDPDDYTSNFRYPKAENGKPAAGIAKRKILLVEDDEGLATVLTLVLEQQMFEVMRACDGKEGLEKVYDWSPDLIISDVMMPRMSGLELVEKLKSDSRTRSIPILMLTANATEERELELMNSGAEDFLAKAKRNEILIARVNRLLANAEA